MKRILLCCTFFITLSLWAQSSHTYEVDFEKKIIYADSLSLPKSINVGALLRLLPELMQRPGDYVLSNYEVQIEEVPMGEASDAVLTVLQLADIDRIEVKNSPTSTDLNNGQSGSINICLRPLAAKRLGLSGTASLSASSEMSVMPNLLADYRGAKVSVRGMAFGELYDGSSTQTNLTPDWQCTSDDTYRQQLARAMIVYQPDSRNNLTLTLSEGAFYDRTELSYTQNSELAPYRGTVTRERQTQLMARAEYKHVFSPTLDLVAKGQYSHNPHKTEIFLENDEYLGGSSNYRNRWMGDVELTRTLSLSNGRSLMYKFGTMGALSHEDAYRVEHQSDTEDESRTLMPFAELAYVCGPLRVKAAAEYVWGNDESVSDWTGRLVVAWQVNRSNRVRLLFDRQMSRPSMLSQIAGGDYIADFTWGEHHLTANAGFNYCSSSNNQRNDHYTNANLMAIYQYRIFFLSFTANQYRKEYDHDADNHDRYRYYNLSLMPSLNFSNGWRTAMNLRYYSNIKGLDVEQGHCMSLQLNLGKSWGNLNAYVYGRAPLTGKTEDHNLATDHIIRYYLVKASYGAGVSYRF